MKYSKQNVISQAESVIERYLQYTKEIAEEQNKTLVTQDAVETSQKFIEHREASLENLGSVEEAAEVLGILYPHSDVLVKYNAKKYAELSY